MKTNPNRRIVRDSIRGSVPGGKLRKAQIRLTDTIPNSSPIAGKTTYDLKDRKTVTEIMTPLSDDAFGITVRGHETTHATKTVLGRKTPVTENALLATNFIEDVVVETMPLPKMKGDGLNEYRRAHLAVAARDLREILKSDRAIKKGTIKDSWEKRNNRLLIALRTKAILAHYRDAYNGSGYGTVPSKTHRDSMSLSHKLRIALGPTLSSTLHKLIKLAMGKRVGKNRAISALTLLLESAPEPENEREKQEIEGDSELLDQVTHGNALEGHMKIVDLKPKSVFNTSEKQITRRHSPDGVHLNVSRYVAAIVSGDSHGLFSRRMKHKPGGTVLIDASGSMGATPENLSQLAKLIPTATIAYYSGTTRGRGQLTIYAKNGMRFSGELPEDSVMGGNAVDLPALRWLMKHPKPWTLISDLGFTGGVLGSELVAKAIVEREDKRGELKVYASFDAAFEVYGGKGQLGNAKRKPAWEERLKIALRAEGGQTL